MTKLPAVPGRTTTSINVRKVKDADGLELARKIRYDVFVIGQNVPTEEEIDQFEEESFHFLALLDGTPAGAARWRFTDQGIKLERFAVLERFRERGVGSALVEAVLKDIEEHPGAHGKTQYLHAQLSAMRLYSKFGFKREGSMFQECDIDHYKMSR
jgi:predicted GNAT family N-acyltransferase